MFDSESREIRIRQCQLKISLQSSSVHVVFGFLKVKYLLQDDYDRILLLIDNIVRQ
jgi:hypothetical protein